MAARSRACYQVGGDYLDVVTEPDGSHLMVVADVAGKGLASALVCTAFRSAFRALARQSLTLRELAGRLSQQHWDEGAEARRRYVTAIFLRLDPTSSEMEIVNAGHNPAFLVSSSDELGSSDRSQWNSPRYAPRLPLLDRTCPHRTRCAHPPLHRWLDRDLSGRRGVRPGTADGSLSQSRSTTFETSDDDQPAEETLTSLWTTLDTFSGGAPQQDDMSAIALCRLTSKSKEKASL